MTRDEIHDVFNKIPFPFPLFEDEVPNTYPIPYAYGWRHLEQEKDSIKELEEELVGALVRNPPVSLYVDIPFCKAKCRFCVYRTTSICQTKSLTESISCYLKLLGKELAKYKTSGVRFSNVRQLYIGGGSPSLLGKTGVQELFKLLECHLELAELQTSCIELEPSSVSNEIISELQKHGVNRFSMGVQDLDDHVLKEQGRVSKARDIKNAIGLLNQANAYYNVDLIYGLPEQRHDSWLSSIEELTRDHAVPEITLYRVRLGTQSDRDVLIDTAGPVARVEQKYLFHRASELLATRNYERVRPCHWVNKKFLNMWEKYKFAPMSDLRPDAQAHHHPSQLGIGTNAITHADALLVRNRPYEKLVVRNGQHLDQGYKVFWDIKNSGDEQHFPYEAYYRLSDADRSARTVLLKLERDKVIDTGDVPAYFQKDFEKFATNEAKDLLCLDDKSDLPCQDDNKTQRYVLTEKGLVFYDYLELYLAHQITKNQKRVDFSTPLDNDWLEKITKILLPEKNSQESLVCVEFGASVGALSIPLISQLHKKGCKTAWYAVDRNPSKLQYYERALHKAKDENNNELGFKIKDPDKNPPLEIESEHVTVHLINLDIESDLLFLSESNSDPSTFPLPKKMDIFFMPSFLKHITFRAKCIEFAWDRLKSGGWLVLGYPDGAWAPVELGPSAHYDADPSGQAHVSREIFREWYREFEEWTAFFDRPINDWAFTLPANNKLQLSYNLATPDLETVYQFLCSRDFSMASRVHEQLNNERKEKHNFRVKRKILELTKGKEWNIVSTGEMENFRYVFQLLQKP
ncbi:MAG: radical SAM protein [Desulfobulbaceae bacterium]|nr:radical SAM protein [Desulfobulbaceae bacterium]